jgi:hypothetical protein
LYFNKIQEDNQNHPFQGSKQDRTVLQFCDAAVALIEQNEQLDTVQHGKTMHWYIEPAPETGIGTQGLGISIGIDRIRTSHQHWSYSIQQKFHPVSGSK